MVTTDLAEYVVYLAAVETDRADKYVAHLAADKLSCIRLYDE